MITIKHVLGASALAWLCSMSAHAQTSAHPAFTPQTPAHQASAEGDGVHVDDAWARATVAQQRATGMFMQLTAPRDLKLVGASTDIAANTEIHEMVKEGDVMKMREVSHVALPAGQTVTFKPGGLHVMFLDLKRQVQAGDVIPVTLQFEDAQGKRETSRIDVTVRPLNASGTPASGHAHH